MSKNWYPVINYEKCIECGACTDKCPHGVYDKNKAPAPVVIQPENCVQGCHGCGVLCPVEAISYVGDSSQKSENCCEGSSCCSPNDNCCTPKPKVTQKKTLVIDFLYLDLNTCERCMGTQTNLDQAIKEVLDVLQSAAYIVKLNKIHINSKELAIKYEFLSSPTIRINGQDITLEVKESCCQDCGDICGVSVDCRVWEYEGIEYDQPPKEMIVNAILKAVYSPGNLSNTKKSAYQFPKNLEVFFEGLEK